MKILYKKTPSNSVLFIMVRLGQKNIHRSALHKVDKNIVSRHAINTIYISSLTYRQLHKESKGT